MSPPLATSKRSKGNAVKLKAEEEVEEKQIERAPSSESADPGAVTAESVSGRTDQITETAEPESEHADP